MLPANRRILDKIKIFSVQVIEKAQKKLSFLFVGKGKLFIKDCSSRNSLHCRARGLFRNATKAVTFYIILRFCTLWSRNYFLKGNLCIYKCFIDV